MSESIKERRDLIKYTIEKYDLFIEIFSQELTNFKTINNLVKKEVNIENELNNKYEILKSIDNSLMKLYDDYSKVEIETFIEVLKEYKSELENLLNLPDTEFEQTPDSSVLYITKIYISYLEYWLERFIIRYDLVYDYTDR